MLGRRLASPYCACWLGSPLTRREATRRRAADTVSSHRKDQLEPDWQWLQNMLTDGPPAAPSGSGYNDGSDDTEYFPGRGVAPRQSDDHLLTTVAEASKSTSTPCLTTLVPVDLMSELLRVFFATIHPVWPILHIPSFFNELYRWDNHSFVALVVSMCMLASRYVADPRVLQDSGEE